MSALQTRPLISIALCTYNGERFLRPQLDSLLAQDYAHFEVVAVDDASTDGTAQILADYARRDPRFRCRRNPRNLGIHGNFERALRDCRGELIAMCDQDDIWLPDKLSVLVEALLDSGALLAYSDSELIDEQGNILGRRIFSSARIEAYGDPVHYVYGHLCSGHATLLRREVVDKAMPIPVQIYHDWWLAFVAASSGRIVYVDRCLVRYRRHGDSITFCIEQAMEERGRGFRARQLGREEARLACFAAFPGREQGFLREFLRLWRKRNNAIIAPGLTAFVLRHRRRLFPNEAPSQRVRHALKCFWGLRLKRWLEPHRYVEKALKAQDASSLTL